ncbi:uncharacterized protein LOC119612643 [Lucilia sericata]|uniref:uncharacterized protein LOC119612643 n=1 Tax=Lucilia sericata TaxID=13632 RepID=UPI0018A84A3D|nr:uncharacterized protein LOC119612643 [Lucilia sericata]
MTHWYNYLLRLVIYHGIFLGFTCVYIDVSRRLVKSYSYVKIFVCLQNFVYITITTWYLIDDFIQFDIRISENLVISFAYIGVSFSRLISLVMIILLRFKGDQILEKCLKMFLSLQRQYFDGILYEANGGNTKIIMIINIIIMTANSLITLIKIVPILLEEAWVYAVIVFWDGYLYALQHYAMLHHGLILSYINYCFSQLNEKLQYGKVEPPLANVYFRLSKVLQELNALYGSTIFSMLLSILLTNSISTYGILINIKNGENFLEYEYLLPASVLIFMSIDLYLYFLICDRVNETARETQRVILEYTIRNNNQEVELLFLGRLVLGSNINICRMFDIDLNSFFVLVGGIVLNAIILFQIHYTKLIELSYDY